MSEPKRNSVKLSSNRSKYDSKEKASEKYWRKCFNDLEKEAFKVNHKRGSVVFDVINNAHIFELVAPILGVEDPRDRAHRPREDDQSINEEPEPVRVMRSIVNVKKRRKRDDDDDSDDDSDDDYSSDEEEEEEGNKEDEKQYPEDEQVDEEQREGDERVIEEQDTAEECPEDAQEDQEVKRDSSEQMRPSLVRGVSMMEDIAEEGEGEGCDEKRLVDEETGSQGSDESEVSSMNVEPPTDHGDDEISYDPYTNPYLNFIRKSKEKATDAWRPRPRPKPTGTYEPDPNLSLVEKSAAITNSITSEFCIWLRSLGGHDELTIDEQVLDELFKIGFDKPAARSLVNRIRELPTLSSSLAKAREIEQADYRVVLHKELQNDIKAERRKPKTTAFGRTLTCPDRFEPPTNGVSTSWLGAKPPEDLATFTTVWDGTMHLKSTKGFCAYLKKHPEVRRPPFLKNAGVFSKPLFGKNSHKSKSTSEAANKSSDSMTPIVSYSNMEDTNLSRASSVNVPRFQRLSSSYSTSNLGHSNLTSKHGQVTASKSMKIGSIGFDPDAILVADPRHSGETRTHPKLSTEPVIVEEVVDATSNVADG